MADVFVSYKRDDLARVIPLVEGLRGDGLTVWWDRDIAPGAPWETTIERELDRARVVIVAWSPAAVASENVKGEARLARGRGTLIQLFVKPCTPPLFFGEQQGVELHDWTGDTNDPRFRAVTAAVRAMLAGEAPAEGVGFASRPRHGWPWFALAAIVLTVAAILALLLQARPSGTMPAGSRHGTAETAPNPRRMVLNSLAGSWDRQDGDCARPIAIDIAVDPARGDVMTVRSPTGFRSIGAVIAVENGAVISRDMSVNANGRREQWEYRPAGNDMTVVDGAGVATKLVRCRTPPRVGSSG